MKRLLIFLFFLSCLNISYAQQKRLALVIGNGNYSFSVLRNPENDARSMGNVLSSIGFEVLEYENLNRVEMTRAIDEFGNKLKDYDLGLFFYAGHGMQADGFNYMVPVDAVIQTETDIEYYCVRADRVISRMDDAGNKLNVIILDACRDNPFERSWTRTTRGRGLATMNAPVGTLIGFATSPGKTASDGFISNGLYTSGILKYITEPGITAVQMFQKVTSYVNEQSYGTQLPWISSSLTGDIYFVKDEADVPEAQEKEDQFISSIAKLPDRSEGEVSLAMLPFRNLTGKEENDWLVTGQYETLLNELSKLSAASPLRVISRGTVNTLKNYEMSAAEIARKIEVNYLVEGSLLSYGDSIMLQLRLVNVYPEEKVIWANSFTSDIPGILRMHAEIARQIAVQMGIGNTAPEQRPNEANTARVREMNPDAYKAYLRGMYNIRQPSAEKKETGLKMLREAINLDPADPFAHAALALGYLEIEHTGLDPEGNALQKAEAEARQAFLLDSTMVDVLAAMSEVYLYQTHEFDKALDFFKRTLALDPGRAATHYHYAWALYLFGDKEGAIREHELAVKYDPLNPYFVAWMGGLYAYYGDYDQAMQELTNASLIFEDYYLCYSLSGFVYRQLGRFDEAIGLHKLLAKDIPFTLGELGITYAAAGDTVHAEEIIKKLEENISPYFAYNIAAIYATMGRNDEAFKWIDYQPQYGGMPWIAVAPYFKNLHGDPRFDEYVKSLNLPDTE